jgi:hypothetical protein
MRAPSAGGGGPKHGLEKIYSLNCDTRQKFHKTKVVGGCSCRCSPDPVKGPPDPGGQNIAYLALVKLGPQTNFLFCPATRAPSASLRIKYNLANLMFVIVTLYVYIVIDCLKLTIIVRQIIICCLWVDVQNLRMNIYPKSFQSKRRFKNQFRN